MARVRRFGFRCTVVGHLSASGVAPFGPHGRSMQLIGNLLPQLLSLTTHHIGGLNRLAHGLQRVRVRHTHNRSKLAAVPSVASATTAISRVLAVFSTRGSSVRRPFTPLLQLVRCVDRPTVVTGVATPGKFHHKASNRAFQLDRTGSKALWALLRNLWSERRGSHTGANSRDEANSRRAARPRADATRSAEAR